MSGQTIITILLVDDHAGVRGAIRDLIERSPLLTIAGEAADGSAAVRMARELEPDLVLMDVGMPGMNGIEATRIVAASGRCRVIMLSLQGERAAVVESLRAGARGYVLKNQAAQELLRDIACVMAGQRYLSERLDDIGSLGATWVESADVAALEQPGTKERVEAK